MTVRREEAMAWIGRTVAADDVIDPGRARAMHASLDLPGTPPGPGEPLPPLWHWLYFWTTAPVSILGPDGLPARGGFLPPIDLPRRMWAGSRVSFPRPLPIGSAARKQSTIADVRMTQGRSGPLAFVTVRHEISSAGDICIVDEHEIVYRAPPTSGAGPRPGEPAPRNTTWQRDWRADPVLLFRYSALTFNGHRIHYDRSYATETEGYPGLVVHGPLLATLMVELVREHNPKARITAFEFRAHQPVFDGSPFTVCGAPAEDGSRADLWIAQADGTVATAGRSEFACL
jgi:3-methylfumaryl-CoA hydratase